MILEHGDKRRENILKNGEVLLRMRSTGGGAKGCMAGGIILIVIAALLMAVFLAMDLALAGTLVFGGFFGIPGILLLLLGVLFQRRKRKKYLDYYQEETGFDKEELGLLEQEIMEPDMIMFGNVPLEKNMGYSEKKPQIACMLTRNYFVMPLIMGKSYIRRVSDMILATYSTEIPGINGYKHGLVFLSRRDDIAYMNAFLTRDVCHEIMKALWEKNPEIIAQQRFSYGERGYDVIKDSPEIVKLYENVADRAVSFKSLLIL